MTKKIDLNTKPKEKVSIPSEIVYKEWTITITDIAAGYKFTGERRTGKGKFTTSYLGNDLRDHLRRFKIILDHLVKEMTWENVNKGYEAGKKNE